MSAPTAQQPLVLKFSGSLVEQLGAQLYPQVTASVAELVSNAWDSDATNVWITIPFDDEWNANATIEVVDDGHGMRRDEAQSKYLVVGRNRRREQGETSEGGRALHGRKGIGKLAAFGTAGWLECVTRRDGETTSFAIDYESLRHHKPTEDYEVVGIDDPDPLVSGTTGEALGHGTRIRLARLRAKRRPNEAAFRRSMTRRFAIDASQMQVFINGEPLRRFEADVVIRFPRDGTPANAQVEVGSDGWATETIPYPIDGDPLATQEVRWWLGFTERPIADEDVRGVSILSRGKLAQRPFMFESSQGTTGQLGQEYLVGEVSADWLDHGVDADEDLIQSNRDQLQLDNTELQPLLDWGRRLLRWGLAQRNMLVREAKVGPAALGTRVEGVIQSAPAASRGRLRTLAGRIAEVTQGDQQQVADAVRAVVEASESGVAARAAEEIRIDGDPDADRTWALLYDADEQVKSGRIALLEARAQALRQFAEAVREPPVERLHSEFPRSPWIVSPLLADVPRDTVVVDERVSVVIFAPVEPLLAAVKVVCWAVGREPDAAIAEADDADLVICSSIIESEPGSRTWAETLSGSADAHEALIATLRGSS